MKTLAVSLIAGLATLAVAGPCAANITYLANRAVGDGSVDLSITTDGAIGELTSGNILDWRVKITHGVDTTVLEGPGGANNSSRLVIGHALSATATDIIFDYDVPSGFFANLFTIAVSSSGTPFWCVSSTGCFSTNAEVISPDGTAILSSAHSERFVVASVGSVTSGAPEPGTWALTIAGFGVVGAAMRRRSRAAA